MAQLGSHRSADIAVGYHLFAADGGLFAFGAVAPLELPRGAVADRRWVAVDRWGEGDGLVAVAEDGAIATVGPGRPHDLPDTVASAVPIIDVATRPRGHGFWALDAVGGVFCFGDAGYFGSIPGLGEQVQTAPIVAMTATPSSMGYWILDAAGGVYAFGDAEFHGSTPALRLETPPAPAVDLVRSSTGSGYAILERNGVIRVFGDAVLDGPSDPLPITEATALAATPGIGGYLVVDPRGFVFPAGTAPMFGSAADLQLRAGIVDINVVCRIDPSAT